MERCDLPFPFVRLIPKINLQQVLHEVISVTTCWQVKTRVIHEANKPENLAALANWKAIQEHS